MSSGKGLKMGKTPVNIEKDLSRIAGLIAEVRYTEPPDWLARRVLASIEPKRLTFFKRLWRRLKTPVAVTPVKFLPAGVSFVAVLALALTFFWRAPAERIVTPGINEVTDQGLNTVTLFLDRPDAKDVEVIGSFNHWSQEGIRMVWDKDRKLWVAALNLKRGSYEYAFRVNGTEIVADPKAILHRDDGFGHQNSILIIGNGNGNEARI
jgi:Glycogen recognition site of AMP-activated protein kinase